MSYMYCKFCGAQIADDSAFCAKCGKRIEDSSTEEDGFDLDSQNIDSFDDTIAPISLLGMQSDCVSPASIPKEKSILQGKKKSDRDTSEEDTERLMKEDASGNFWTHLHDTVIYDVNIDAEHETSNGINVYSLRGRETERILTGHAVESFYICDEWAMIVFREYINGRGTLWTCDLNGEDLQQIVGGNDSAEYYTVTNEMIFIVVKDRRGDKFLYQISTDLQSSSVLKRRVDIRRPIVADDTYLYYTIFDTPNKMCLVQYDISAKKERVILKNVGISAIQLYRGELVVSTYLDCMFANKRGEELVLISPEQMRKRILAQAYTKEIVCYLDQIFYIDIDTEHVFVVPLTGGTPREIYSRRSIGLNLYPFGAGIALIDQQKRERLMLSFGEDISYKIQPPLISNSTNNSQISMSKEESPIKAEDFKQARVFEKLISAGFFHTVLLRVDGTVVGVGSNNGSKIDVATWRDVVAISAGTNYTVALKSDGTVISTPCTDENNFGQDQVQKWHHIIQISAGDSHTLGLKEDGTVVSTICINKRFDQGQCNVQSWNGLVAVSAGMYHSLGMRSNGTAVATGRNIEGQCDVQEWTDLVAIAAGMYHSLGLRSDGTVVATGRNVEGQCDVQDWKDIISIYSGTYHSVGLKANGTVVSTIPKVSKYNCGQANTKNWKDVVAISGGMYHKIGLKSDGTLISTTCPEEKDYGQCELGSIKLFHNICNLEEERAIAIKARSIQDNQIAQWKRDGVCLYCGGKFAGIITKRCSNCGKKKNY